MSARPVFGVTACTRGVGAETAQVVIDRYLVNSARHADAAALLIPARPDLMTAREIAGRLDGLLLTGSPSNVAPARYGDAAAGDGPFDTGRDAMSLALIEAMLALGRPVFGICRGFQEINVAFGGTLARDLSAAGRPLPHHAPEGAGLAAMFGHSHDVALVAGGVLSGWYDAATLRVNSVHYQGIGRLGDGLAAEAFAEDGIVEAVSATVGGAALLGVQWHPEWQTDADAVSKGFFRLFGQVLRGQPMVKERAA